MSLASKSDAFQNAIRFAGVTKRLNIIQREAIKLALLASNDYDDARNKLVNDYLEHVKSVALGDRMYEAITQSLLSRISYDVRSEIKKSVEPESLASNFYVSEGPNGTVNVVFGERLTVALYKHYSVDNFPSCFYRAIRSVIRRDFKELIGEKNGKGTNAQGTIVQPWYGSSTPLREEGL